MNYPFQINGRWQLGEFLFVEYRRASGVLVDIGPFPKDPDEEETEKAYQYLADAALDFLTLADTEWAIDLDKLSERFPHFDSDELHGRLTHDPAFEEVSPFLPNTPRWFNVNHWDIQSREGLYFLRILFSFDKTEPLDGADAARLEDDQTPKEADRG